MKIAFIFSIIALSLASAAEQPRDVWYVAADIGQTGYDYSENNQDGFVVLDDDKTAWGVSAGYFALPWLAFEAAYINHGSLSGFGSHCPPPAVCIGLVLPVNGELESLSLSVLPIWYINERLSLNAKLGISRWDLSSSLPAPKTDGSEFLYGGFMTIHLTEQLDLRAGFEKAGNRDSLLAGLRWRF